MHASTIRVLRNSGFVVAALFLIAGRSAAQVPSAGEQVGAAGDQEQRIKDLEDQVGRLNKETREHETGIDLLKRFPPAQWKDGFIINSADNAYKLKITGYTHFDGRFFLDDEDKGDVNRFLFRRVRLSLEGTVARYFDYRIMPDFAGSSLALFDAYTDITYFPGFKLRVGKFKPPVGLERLQSATAIPFVERGLPTNLVPSRDLGVQLWGEPWSGALSYALGIFNGAQDGQNNDGELNDDKDFAGRIFAHPLRHTRWSAFENLGVGIAGTFGHQKGSASGPDLPNYRSAGQATIFRYRTGAPATAADTAVAAGNRWRISPQTYFYYGPFGLLGEYVVSSSEVTINNEHETLDHSAWQIATSYVLTGEPGSYKGVVPFKPFNPFFGKWGWGAWEVAFRVGQLFIDEDAFDKGFADKKRSVEGADEFQVGLNWYLNRNIKVVLDYANTSFDGGASKPGATAGTTVVDDRETEHVIFTRLQFIL
jgi:phosphate-selective porin OprO/OprP